MAGCVIFPRLPSAGNSVIFWGDVAAHQEFRTYLESFQRIINDGFLDEQYCLQAWFAARLLRRKHRWLRRSIAMFFVALGLSFGLYLWIAATGGGRRLNAGEDGLNRRKRRQRSIGGRLSRCRHRPSLSAHPSRAMSQAGRSAILTRCCAAVSRSRTVTVSRSSGDGSPVSSPALPRCSPERLEVDGDAEGRAGFVLAGVAAADGAGLVVEAVHVAS